MADLTISERLGAVRSKMAKHDLDALIIQRTDQHNSEYLSSDQERVAWLTGFTGSNALLVLTLDEAAVFSDGRYTVQLDEEVDAKLFERCHIIKQPAAEWLKSRLKEGQKLGLDPYLSKQRELETYQKLANRQGAELYLIQSNPLDEAWDDQGRPAPPRQPVKCLDEQFHGEDRGKKCERMAEAVKKAGCDWLLVTATDEIAWLLNIRGCDIDFNPLCLSHLLLNANSQARWFVDPLKLPNDLDLGGEIEIKSPGSLAHDLQSISREKSTILCDPSSVHVGYTTLIEAAGGSVVRASSPIVLAKACKNETELDGARRAQMRDALAITRFLYWLDHIPLDGSVSEMDAAQKLGDERAKLNLHQGPSFETISAHGPNAALPHYRVSPKCNRPLTGETLYLVDSGGQYLDGTTDITRTIALGQPSGEMKTRFTAVLRGHIALARAIFPKDTHGGQLDALARQPLWASGLDFDHGTGHGIGSFLCVHEGPQRIAKASSGAALKPGMILSNEPGYYKQDHYGIRIENLLIVQECQLNLPDAKPMLGFETITLAPIDRRVIDVDALNDNEIEWLDNYHARVSKSLSGQLSNKMDLWLKQACRPLGQS